MSKMETISDILNGCVAVMDDVTTEMCDRYCKWPELIEDEDELQEKCKGCPMNAL